MESNTDHKNAAAVVEKYRMLEILPSNASFMVGNLPENVVKNRYQRIMPYDHNRVILLLRGGLRSNDYINASSININVPEISYTKRYIACQGPLKNTEQDFWEMIWQEDIKIIVMLTELFDSQGLEKCHKYWPEDDSDQSTMVGSLDLRSKIIKDDDLMAVRFIFLHRNDNATSQPMTKTIKHIQFKQWMDFGVPEKSAFYKLYEEANKPVDENYGSTTSTTTTVIHCSAGIGRTGTFLLFDLLVNARRRRRVINNFSDFLYNNAPSFVELLRQQRMGMVETEQQFVFACESARTY